MHININELDLAGGKKSRRKIEKKKTKKNRDKEEKKKTNRTL